MPQRTGKIGNLGIGAASATAVVSVDPSLRSGTTDTIRLRSTISDSMWTDCRRAGFPVGWQLPPGTSSVCRPCCGKGRSCPAVRTQDDFRPSWIVFFACFLSARTFLPLFWRMRRALFSMRRPAITPPMPYTNNLAVFIKNRLVLYENGLSLPASETSYRVGRRALIYRGKIPPRPVMNRQKNAGSERPGIDEV